MAASISNMFIPLSKSPNESSFPSYYTKFPVRQSISLPLLKSLSITIRKPNSKYDYYKAFLERDEEQEVEELEESHSHQPNPRTVADIWREIHGENDWCGLLDPMDPLMRSELIRYGEMTQACYDAFDHDSYSKYCGSCRYTRHQLFDSLDMPHNGYTVTRYLYATATPNTNLYNFFAFSRWPKMWSKHANWIGYVAVSDDDTSNRIGRRDITVAWRGTVTNLEWDVIMNSLIPVSSRNIPCPENGVKVDSGLLDLYTNKEDACVYSTYSAREQVLVEVKKLVEMYGDEELSITITGHSLGSALAIVSAYDIAETGLNLVDNRRVPVSVFSFSGWKVGNVMFKERLRWLGVKVLRVVNVRDFVPKMPGFVFSKIVGPIPMDLVAADKPWSYSHVGVELPLDHKDSPFLNPDADDLIRAHNLEAHLHLLDGYQGRGRKFVLANGRDPTLVNKDSDFLKDHYMVPPYWWREKNKGMIRTKDGTWVQPERSKFEGHPDDIDRHLNQLGLT